MTRSVSRFTLIVLPLMLVLACPAAAQKGKLVFTETTHAFGTVYEGDEATYTFTFRNEGDAPLKLISVNPSCGCTTPEWTRDPIAPGGTGSVTVSFDSKGLPGPFHKRIAVNSDGDPMQVILDIEGEVHPRPLQEPTAQGNLLIERYSADLGELEAGQVPYVRVRIQNGGTRPLLIKSIRTPGEHVFASYPGNPIGAGELAEIAFSVNTTGMKSGSRFDYELLLETDDPQQPLKKLHVKGSVKESTGAK